MLWTFTRSAKERDKGGLQEPCVGIMWDASELIAKQFSCHKKRHTQQDMQWRALPVVTFAQERLVRHPRGWWMGAAAEH